ncbi:succinate dehydrogenase cytochrome b subunit [Desulfoluna spongiiphila]|uniref:Succinate dehydrogenase subunit C n=1 Tax=Desulfoluna spongiiphila TaxID=419481 RepID=A0A1G5HWA4_9BACT|nr:succinate dehydrogenase cytochrome b subunit [Desulfoluna spongiiphila]SCY67991.1 succinate dehydrogenase subunit C [Desulfoluna spongiiphila]
MMDFIGRIATPVGKKMLMGITGLGFCGFLVVHLAGNFTLFQGAEAFAEYTEKLHSLGFLLQLSEFVLLLMALAHVLTGVVLALENLQARPERYQVTARHGGRTLGSSTMIYTGLLTLAFIVLHLIGFKFSPPSGASRYPVVVETFSRLTYVGAYLLGILAISFHVSHGFWSAFQSLGANGEGSTPFLMRCATWLAVGVGIGFGSIPLVFFLL